MTYNAKIISGGKVVIPADLRRELGVKDGDDVVFEHEDGKIVLKSYAQVVREVQARFRKRLSKNYQGSMVDDLIAERRAKAAREEAEMERYRKGGI